MRLLVRALCVALLCFSAALAVSAQDSDAPLPKSPEGGPVEIAQISADEQIPVNVPTDEAEAAALSAADATLGTQIAQASEDQASHEEASGEVASRVVPEAGSALLANGDGDVSTTGLCAGDFDHFCKSIKPGEGRLYDCLKAQIESEELGNVEGRTIAAECHVEMSNFAKDRSTNINKNIPLARACKKDVKKFCKDEKKSKDPDAIMACLKEHDALNELSGDCGLQMFKIRFEAALDYRTDASLNRYCHEDAAKYCTDVEPVEGLMQYCLRENRHDLQWECQEDLFRQDVQNADDIRFDISLLRTCMADKLQFCGHIQYGNSQVKECLEENRLQDNFSPDCRNQLEEIMARRAGDFRLDSRLVLLCAEDIKSTCGIQVEHITSVEGDDGRVLNCLQDFRHQLKGPECREEVHKIMVRSTQDVRFNLPLAEACAADRERFCGEVQPGSARVIRCLQDHRADVDFDCRTALFDQEVKMAEDIDFKFPMKLACSSEVSQFCADVPHGHAHVIRCLQEHTDDYLMGAGCRQVVADDAVRSSTDHRLNFRLNQACEGDLAVLCAAECSNSANHDCGGMGLRCLQSHQDEITTEECKKEIFYFEKMEADDYRNDVLLAEACRTDVEKHCKKVTPGNGAVLDCLREHRDDLTESCRAEELNLNIIQARDVRLRPKLRKICSREIATHCKDVKPGQGRVLQCLQENLAQPDFGSLCREQMEERSNALAGDYRLDYGVSTACEGDIAGFCGDAQGKAHGKANVMKCLVHFHDDLTTQCGAETSRAARMALWEYKKGVALTADCDADVIRFCSAQRKKSRGVWSIGAVGRCLSHQLALGSRLSDQCQVLVRAAAPQDSRAVIDAKSATKLVVDKLAELQHEVQRAAQTNAILVNAKLVDPDVTNASFLTLTGWVAAAGVAAGILLLGAGGWWGIRKLFVRETPYTLVRPRDGDV